MRPEHLDLLHSVGRPSLTPDGATAVVSVVHPDLKPTDIGPDSGPSPSATAPHGA